MYFKTPTSLEPKLSLLLKAHSHRVNALNDIDVTYSEIKSLLLFDHRNIQCKLLLVSIVVTVAITPWELSLYCYWDLSYH